MLVFLENCIPWPVREGGVGIINRSLNKNKVYTWYCRIAAARCPKSCMSSMLMLPSFVYIGLPSLMKVKSLRNNAVV